MKKDKAICYYCTSVYQVLVLTMMVELRYEQYKNIVIMEENVASKLCLHFAKPYINEIIVLPSGVSKYEIEKRFYDVMKKNAVALFGFFTWGGNGGFIYDLIPDNIPAILLDEGVSTCEYKKFMSYVVKDIDFSKIKEVWMFDTNISQNDKLVPEYRIPVEEIYNDKDRFQKYLVNANKLFAYKWEPVNVDILFFDRYLVQLGRIPIKYERFVLESLVSLVPNMKMGIKVHPFEDKNLAKWRYRDLPVEFYKDITVPWELIVLNYMYQYRIIGNTSGFPRVLIATNTTTLFNTQNLLYSIGLELPIIYINKVIHKYLRDIEIVAEKTIEEYQHIYKDRKIFLPLDWKEVYEDLRLCLPDISYDSYVIEKIDRNEYSLLSSEYIKTFQAFAGNLLQKICIEVEYVDKALNEVIEKQYFSYIVGGERQYSVTFKEFRVKDASQINIRLFPIGVPPICNKVTLEKLWYNKDGTRVEKEKNINFILNKKMPYILFDIDAGNSEISNLEISYKIDVEFHVLFEVEQKRRFRDYYDNLIKWIELLQQGECFENFCRKKGYKRIGIYGNGTIGKLLYNQLNSCGLETIVIDKKAMEGVIRASDFINIANEWDLIIITPLFDFYNIKKFFNFSDSVIGLDDFLNEIEREEMQ